MTPEQYSQWVWSRWHGDEGCGGLAIAALGINGEAGEVSEPIKKFLRDGKPVNSQELLLELGDVLYYTCWLAEYYGYSLQDIMDANVEKLTERDAKRSAARPLRTPA